MCIRDRLSIDQNTKKVTGGTAEVKYNLSKTEDSSIKTIVSNLKEETLPVFGRVIGDQLNIPVLGYTTSPTFTDLFVESHLSKYLPFSLKRELDTLSDEQINSLYTMIKKQFTKTYTKYGVRTLLSVSYTHLNVRIFFVF